MVNRVPRVLIPVPLFDCTFYAGKLTEMRNDSKQHREAFGEILNQAAWDYKYLHSWVTKGQTQAKPHSESESLHFCIHNNVVKGFKAYKVSIPIQSNPVIIVKTQLT